MSIYVWNSEIKNIYVWTTPVKEVYVWTTKVRPSGYEYSYNFRNKTLNKITSDGWKIATGSFPSSFWDMWLTASWWSRLIYNTGILLTNSTKITYEGNWNIPYGWIDVDFWSWMANEAWIYWSSSYNWYSQPILLWPTTTDWPSMSNIWDVYIKIILDCKNKKMELNIWSWSKTYNIADTDLQNNIWLPIYLSVLPNRTYCKNISCTIK